MDESATAEVRATLTLEAELVAATERLDGTAPLLARMVRFHLGWIDTAGVPTDEATRIQVQGKRIRPQIAQLCCTAAGGDVESATPLAAAIELLHNFTLIHDDIQDRSPNRRHRATVWRVWGDAQAINAGDGLFAASQLTLLGLRNVLDDPGTVLDLVDEFNRVTIEIVRGQVMDLEFEAEQQVPASDYLQMIEAKTAAIIRFAAWAGAVVGGAGPDTAHHLANMGLAMGMGFQIRDDVLGIWGLESVTGKAEADDIRRRKKSLPILLLLERATPDERERLQHIYATDEIDAAGIDEILAILDRHEIANLANAHVRRYHDAASRSLDLAAGHLTPRSAAALATLIDRLDTRSF